MMNEPAAMTNGTAPHKSYPHIFVFDNMRLRSHLFWRWISTHPALYTTYHRYLLAGFLGADSILPDLNDTEARTNENRAMLEAAACDESFETSNRTLENDVLEAERRNKTLFTNEHIICLLNHNILLDILGKGDEGFTSFNKPILNPTVLNDRLLGHFTPIILIRHPVLQVESVYTSMVAYSQCRPGGENFDLITSFHYHRLVFEYFRKNRGKPPIVIDGEDILWRTKQLGENLCEAIGIDPAGLKDTWETLGEEWWADHPFLRTMTKTIHESTGIERPETKASRGLVLIPPYSLTYRSLQPETPDIDKAFPRWTEKYGQDVAGQLKERVDVAMPHYNLLVQYKI